MIGRILDASSLDAAVADDMVVTSLIDLAHASATPVYVPELAVSEVRSLRPESLDVIDDVLEQAPVLRRDPNASARAAVRTLLLARGMFDVGAAHAIIVSGERGWPVITGDVGRLRRLDPTVDVLLL